MTLTASMNPFQNACVGVRVRELSCPGFACCPNCGQELRVSLASCCGTALMLSVPQSPNTPQVTCFAQRPFFPQSPGCTISTPRIFPTSFPDYNIRYQNTIKALKLSGWYYGNLDWQSAIELLKESSPGTFLLRDSGDRNFKFSLSVQTERGPTSVRLHYEMGYFWLDCDKKLARFMPRFPCVIELVHYYSESNRHTTIWVDRDGCPHSPVLLKTPLRRKPPSLLHAVRLSIHKALDANPLNLKLKNAPKHTLLPLPSKLLDYLGEYPYSI